MRPNEHRPPQRLVLFLFALLVGLLFADQNLMAPNLTLIGGEFGFSREKIDARLGAEINLIFWLFGGFVTLVVGYFVDRAGLPRKWMLFAVAVVGQLACIGSGVSQTYEQLYWSRALNAVGIGGSIPLLYSLLGDLFPPNKRANAAALISLSTGLGLALGQVLAGSLAPSYGWRAPFLVIASVGLLVSLLFALFFTEPIRGHQEQALQKMFEAGGRYEARINWRDIPSLFRIRTNLLVFSQAIPGSIPWGMIFVYFNDFYVYDKGFSSGEAVLLVMLLGASAIVGGFFGGRLGQYALNRSPRYLPLLCGVTTILGVLPTTAMIWYPGAAYGIWLAFVFAVLTGLLASVTGPNVNVLLMNANLPEHRGTVFGLFNLCNDLGKGFGASAVGLMAAHMGRIAAFHLSSAMWLLSGALLLVLARYFPQDEASMQTNLANISK